MSKHPEKGTPIDMEKEQRDLEALVKVPAFQRMAEGARQLLEKGEQLKKLRTKLRKELGRTPTDVELHEELARIKAEESPEAEVERLRLEEEEILKVFREEEDTKDEEAE